MSLQKATNDLFERWHPYWNWECYQDGMWKQRRKQMLKIQQCARVLSNADLCRAAMVDAIEAYPISAEQHLSKREGRRPWMGQAACSAALGATEEETRVAWNFYMSEESQNLANEIADEIIAEWESCNA